MDSLAGPSSAVAESNSGLSVVPFTIQEGDNIYQGHIDLQSLLQMESDNGFRQIILDNLKAVGVQPSKAGSLQEAASQSAVRAFKMIPTPNPISRPSLAQGKYGAVWDSESTRTMLERCLAHKKAFYKKRTVEDKVWASISDEVFAINEKMDYNGEQCREKMRNLKRAHKEFNSGKQKYFEFCDLMVAIFDTPIEEQAAMQLDRVTDFALVGNSSISFSESGPSITSFVQESSTSCSDHVQSLDLEADLQSFPDTDQLGNDTPTPTPTMHSETMEMSLTEKSCQSGGPINSQSDTMSGPENKKSGTDKPVQAVPAAIRLKKIGAGGSAGNWDKDSTLAVVQAFLQRKQEVQRIENIPQRVFKDISDELKSKGFNMNPSVCRDKFTQMNDFFTGVLPSGGFMSGFKWPHYDNFCELHDIPFDFILPVNQESLAYEPAGNVIWTEPAVFLLLSEYHAKKNQFDNTKSPIRHQLLFNEISDTMNNFLIPVSTKQCLDQMNVLKIKFRQEYDRLNVRNTGQPPTTWPYYDKMLEIFQGCASLDAPFLLSAGKGLFYSVKGKQNTSSSSGTRTRPKEAKESGVTPKKPLTAQQYREMIVVQRSTATDELKLLREGLERRSVERSAEMKNLTEVLRDYVNKQQQ